MGPNCSRGSSTVDGGSLRRSGARLKENRRRKRAKYSGYGFTETYSLGPPHPGLAAPALEGVFTARRPVWGVGVCGRAGDGMGSASSAPGQYHCGKLAKTMRSKPSTQGPQVREKSVTKSRALEDATSARRGKKKRDPNRWEASGKTQRAARRGVKIYAEKTQRGVQMTTSNGKAIVERAPKEESK